MSNHLPQADEDALLAAEAFAFGLFDEYVEARRSDVRTRIAERFGGSGGSTDGPSAGKGNTVPVSDPGPSGNDG